MPRPRGRSALAHREGLGAGGSHPLADARGADDHEGQTFSEVLGASQRIIAGVEIPVSLDRHDSGSIQFSGSLARAFYPVAVQLLGVERSPFHDEPHDPEKRLIVGTR